MRDSAVIANRFLALAKESGDSLTAMQLLKLVYIAHGWFLGLYGKPLIEDEVQAWQYGPVIPRLYNRIRRFKAAPVEGPIAPVGTESLSSEEESIIRQVYDLYGSRTGPELSRMTHAAGTPWRLIYRHGCFGTVIPNDLIEDYYRRLAVPQAAS